MSKLKELNNLWEKTKNTIYIPSNYLKLLSIKKKFSLKLLKFTEVKLFIPEKIIPNCTDCSFICCTGPKAIVNLKLRDIALLIDNNFSKYISNEKDIRSVYKNQNINKNLESFDNIYNEISNQVEFTNDKKNILRLINILRKE